MQQAANGGSQYLSGYLWVREQSLGGRDAGTKVKMMFKYLLFNPVLIDALNHPNQLSCRCRDNRAD